MAVAVRHAASDRNAAIIVVQVDDSPCEANLPSSTAELAA